MAEGKRGHTGVVTVNVDVGPLFTITVMEACAAVQPGAVAVTVTV